MKRERVVGVALRAYPRDTRLASGEEILATALDVSAGSWRVLQQESIALVLGGLRARASLSVADGTKRLIADACCQAATLMGTLGFAGTLVTYIMNRYVQPERTGVVSEVLLAGFVLLALLGYDRAAAIFGVAALLGSILKLLDGFPGLGLDALLDGVRASSAAGNARALGRDVLRPAHQAP